MLTAALPGTVAVFCYLASAFRQSQTLSGHRRPARGLVLWLGLVAVISHAFSLTALIFMPEGLHLSFFKVSSLVCFTISLLILLSSVWRPLENLFVLLFPVAAVAEMAALVMPAGSAPRADFDSGLIAHVLLSILAYSVVTIACMQAILLAIQERALRHKRTIGVIQVLPPLETMETLMFQMVWVGLVLLTLGIASGFLFVEDIRNQHIAHKMFFSILAWFVFTALLIGRHRLGWRGTTAIRWTLGGGILLLTGYFGSKLVLELVLERI